MSNYQTLPEFTKKMRERYPHVSKLADIRDQASLIVSSMLDDLKAARSKSGLTQGDVGKALGVSQPTISRYEKGLENITLRDFVSFALACNQRTTLVITPENDFSNEDVAREVVRKLIEQLYPDPNVNTLLSGSRRQKQVGMKDLGREHSPVENQAEVATRAAWTCLASLAVALDNLHGTNASTTGR